MFQGYFFLGEIPPILGALFSMFLSVIIHKTHVAIGNCIGWAGMTSSRGSYNVVGLLLKGTYCLGPTVVPG